jgi:regulator of replication initiation timing
MINSPVTSILTASAKLVSTVLQRLKAHYAQYEPTLKELKSKYESLMKEKTLTRLERDRLAAKVGCTVECVRAAVIC